MQQHDIRHDAWKQMAANAAVQLIDDGMVILPIDQDFEHGPARSFAPNPAAYDPRYHFKLAIEAGCNAYAAPLVFLEAGVSNYYSDIPLILKWNNHERHCHSSRP